MSAKIRACAFALLTLHPGLALAQQDVEIARAIEALDDASPVVRARARAALLRLGEPALAALRMHIDAAVDVSPELLFVIAEEIGDERRQLAVVLFKDLGTRSWHIAWRPDGKQLALIDSHQGKVTIYDPELNATPNPLSTGTSYFAFAPSSEGHVRGGGGGAVIHTDERDIELRVAEAPMVGFSPDGKLVTTSGYGNVVDVWNAADGTRARQFTVGGTKGGLTPVFSPDGKLLVIGNRNDTTSVFDAAKGELLHVLDRPMTQQLAFSPDGKLLAVGYVDGKLGIWDPDSGELVKLLDSGAKEVFTVAWSPDGALLASAGHNGPIAIYSRKHLTRLKTLESGSERTFRLAFRPDGKLLVAAGNQTTRAWTIASAR